MRALKGPDSILVAVGVATVRAVQDGRRFSKVVVAAIIAPGGVVEDEMTWAGDRRARLLVNVALVSATTLRLCGGGRGPWHYLHVIVPVVGVAGVADPPGLGRLRARHVEELRP